MDKPPQPGFVPPPPYTPQAQSMPMYPPPPQQPSVVVIQAQTFGPDPQPMTCPNCNMQITTKVDTESTTKTHLFALLLCIIGCWPCVPCPYCIDSCMAKKHYCPQCRAYLGEYDN